MRPFPSELRMTPSATYNFTGAFTFQMSIAIALGLLVFACPLTVWAQTPRFAQDLFFVDLSGSMVEKLPQTPLEVRQRILKEWLESHKDSEVMLASFDTEIHEQRTPYNLAKPNELERAERWLHQLPTKKPRGTNLWRSLEKSLTIAQDLIQKHPDVPITLHFLTDGIDTEHVTTAEKVLQAFAGLHPRRIASADGAAGDFDIEISAPTSSPPSVSLPSPSPSSVSSPSPSISPSPALGTTQTPSPSSSISPIASPTQTPTVTAEVQEPRIVFDRQFVYFVNKTLPNADSYLWHVKWNPPRPEGSETLLKTTPCASPNQNPTEKEKLDPADEAEVSGTDFVYQFLNPCGVPRSYSVILTATYKETKINAPSISILVQPHGITESQVLTSKGFDWEGSKKSMDLWLGYLATIVTGVSSVISAIRRAKEKPTAAPDTPKWERPLNFLKFFWLPILLALLCVGFLGLSVFLHQRAATAATAEKNVSDTAKMLEVHTTSSVSSVVALPSPVAAKQSNLPPVNFINAPVQPPTSASNANQYIGQFVVMLLLIILLTLGAAAMWLLTFKRAQAERASEHPDQSFVTQLRDLEELVERKVISRKHAMAFKNAVLERAYKQYGIPPPKQTERPRGQGPPKQRADSS